MFTDLINNQNNYKNNILDYNQKKKEKEKEIVKKTESSSKLLLKYKPYSTSVDKEKKIKKIQDPKIPKQLNPIEKNQSFYNECFNYFSNFNLSKETTINFTELFFLRFNMEEKNNFCHLIKLISKDEFIELFCDPDLNDDRLCEKLKSKMVSSSIIQFFKLSEEYRVKIALHAAAHPEKSERLGVDIKNYRISCEKNRIAIALECINYQYSTLPAFIKSFEINDQQTLIHIAKIFAKKQPNLIATYLKSFGIKNEEILDQITLLTTLSKYLDKNGVKEEKEIYIDRFMSRFNYEKKFENLVSNLEFIEFVEIFCIPKSPIDLINNLKNNPNTLCIISYLILEEINELALYLAEKSSSISYVINEFRIHDQETLIKIAFLCVKHKHTILQDYIHHFNIEDEKIRYELALICAKKNPFQTILAINNFKIKEESKLVEIALLCGAAKPEDCIKYFNKFNIQSEKNIRRICLNLAYIVNRKENIKEENKLRLIKQITKILDHDGKLAIWIDTPASIENLYKFSIDFFGEGNAFLNEITEIEKIENTFLKDQIVNWMKHVLLLSGLLGKTNQQTIATTRLIPVLKALPISFLRQELTNKFFTLLSNQEALTLFIQDKTLSKKAPEKLVLDLLLSHLQASGISEKIINSYRKIFGPIVTNDLSFGISIFQLVNYLHNSLSLSTLKKEEILKLILGDAEQRPRENGKKYQTRLKELQPQLKENSAAALQLFLFKEEKRFKNCKNLALTVQELMQDKFSFSEKSSTENFQKFFINTRHPSALLTYTANLAGLNEKIVMDTLNRYVKSVVNGNFLEERYYSKTNVHLKKIENEYPDVFNQWQKPLESFQICLSEEENFFATVVDTDNYFDFLVCGTEVPGSCQRINGDAGKNKALLNYALGGENRLVAVKCNITDKILARAVIHLIHDGDRPPVILLESFYGVPQWIEACKVGLLHMAKNKAKTLNIKIVRSTPRSSDKKIIANFQPYGRDLKALDNGIPYGYSDAGPGITAGKYEISGSTITEI